MQIAHKTIIVTGGCSGIGLATVQRLVNLQAKVAIFDVNEAAGHALVEELGSEHVAYYQVDVSNESDVSRAIEQTLNTLGRIYACCNYAGILLPEKTIGREGVCSLDKFNKTISVNLIGSFNITRLVAAAMVDNIPENDCRGVIINTASVAAYEGQAGQAAYSASKAGIIGMTLPIARDLSRWGIRVNAIAPGIIHTPIFDNVKPEVYESLQQQVLSPKRLGDPDEVAHLAQQIIENDYFNASCLRLDGGIRMQ